MASKIKTKASQSQSSHIALKILGWILLVAIISFGALTGLKIYNDGQKVAESQEKNENINTAEVENDSIKNAEPDNDNKTTAGNEAKAKTDELEKQQAKEVERNENGLKIANVLLNEPYKVDGKVIISSTITNVVETEGDCVYIFTSGSTSLTKKTQVLPNAKNTVCEAVVLDKNTMNAGEWKVRLEYKSKNSEGVSETKTFTIQ